MRSTSILSLLAVATAASTQDAPVIQNNPIGAQYSAELKPKAPWEVSGAVKIASAPDGKGVSVEIALANLPSEGGPFSYHIHEKPVPSDGNCTGAGAHLDPYKRGEDPICNADAPSTCQTGDLSGKHGAITSPSFSATYTDDFLATLPSDPSYFGNLSIVVHLANRTRITCANFSELSPGAVSSNVVSAGTSYGTALPSASHPSGGRNASATATATASTGAPIAPTSSPTDAPPATGGAQKVVASAGALVVFAFAAAMMI